MSFKTRFSLSFLNKEKICITFGEDIRDIIFLNRCDDDETFPCGEDEDDLDEEAIGTMIQKEEDEIKSKGKIFLECVRFNDRLKGIYVKNNKIFVVLKTKSSSRWKSVICDILSTFILVLNPTLILKEIKEDRLFSAEFLVDKIAVEKICKEKSILVCLDGYANN